VCLPFLHTRRVRWRRCEQSGGQDCSRKKQVVPAASVFFRGRRPGTPRERASLHSFPFHTHLARRRHGRHGRPAGPADRGGGPGGDRGGLHGCLLRGKREGENRRRGKKVVGVVNWRESKRTFFFTRSIPVALLTGRPSSTHGPPCVLCHARTHTRAHATQPRAFCARGSLPPSSLY
jgi:hypothetical protein